MSIQEIATTGGSETAGGKTTATAAPRPATPPISAKAVGDRPTTSTEAVIRANHPSNGSASHTTNTPNTGPITGFPENTLSVTPWLDPVLDELGHDPRSLYVERYWLPILGPSATLLLRRFAMGLEASPEGFEVDCAEWAQQLGIGMRGGKNGPFWRALDRTCRFGTARRNGEYLAVRPKLPPLTMHQVVRLPVHLQAAHHAWSVRQLSTISSKSPSAA